jgi:hypothetical protein
LCQPEEILKFQLGEKRGDGGEKGGGEVLPVEPLPAFAFVLFHEFGGSLELVNVNEEGDVVLFIVEEVACPGADFEGGGFEARFFEKLSGSAGFDRLSELEVAASKGPMTSAVGAFSFTEENLSLMLDDDTDTHEGSFFI